MSQNEKTLEAIIQSVRENWISQGWSEADIKIGESYLAKTMAVLTLVGMPVQKPKYREVLRTLCNVFDIMEKEIKESEW